jgi:PRC-barrel domain
MADAMTGKPLIESDRVEGTTVYDPQGNNIGTIKRLMIEKLSGRVAYAIMSFGGISRRGVRGALNPLEQADLRHQSRRLPDRRYRRSTARRARFLARSELGLE